MAATSSGTHASGESLSWIALALGVLAPAACGAELLALARGWDPNQIGPLLIIGPATINIAAAATGHRARRRTPRGARGRWMATVALVLAYVLFAILLALAVIVHVLMSCPGFGE